MPSKQFDTIVQSAYLLFIVTEKWNKPNVCNLWMFKQNMIYPYDRIIFDNKNKLRTNTFYNEEEPGKCYKWKKPAMYNTYCAIIWQI